MKKILITGKDSYIGTSVEKWLMKYPFDYSIDTVDMKEEFWKRKDFSIYDVVFHVAGIAHVSNSSKKEGMYYRINRDLAIEVSNKAKNEGVTQFIFMSSIIVYGNKSEIIDKNTIPDPHNIYGNSKLLAEKGIKKLEDSKYRVVILRAPMIYGKGSKGNYQKMAKMAKRTPIFPNIDNQRSMLHIDNLCEFIKLMIDNEENGLFFPQNEEYVKTSKIVKLIGEVHGKRIRLTRIFNPFLRLARWRIPLVKKVFGNLVYEKSLSVYKDNYRIRNFKETIIMTEK